MRKKERGRRKKEREREKEREEKRKKEIKKKGRKKEKKGREEEKNGVHVILIHLSKIYYFSLNLFIGCICLNKKNSICLVSNDVTTQSLSIDQEDYLPEVDKTMISRKAIILPLNSCYLVIR